MFITKFSIEDWIGNQNKGCVKQANVWSEIELAIRGLDGHNKTLVTLETDSETHMSIGGGQGKYVVYVTFDNEMFYSLTDPSKPETDEFMVVGGQESLYSAKSCVDLIGALQAAEIFAETGKMLESVVWEKDKIAEMV
jgi:hypothetical protein